MSTYLFSISRCANIGINHSFSELFIFFVYICLSIIELSVFQPGTHISLGVRDGPVGTGTYVRGELRLREHNISNGGKYRKQKVKVKTQKLSFMKQTQ